MFTVSHEIPVKHVEAGLTRAQVWQGLVLKAENPVPFLPVLERQLDERGTAGDERGVDLQFLSLFVSQHLE